MVYGEIEQVEGYPFIAYQPQVFSPAEQRSRSASFYKWLNQRRTVRNFSNAAIDPEVIRNIIRAASTAPSGAHKQPWTFCIVSNPDIKKQIRVAAEKEEFDSYNGRMSEEWKDDIRHLQTDWHKPFLEVAPFLIVVFKQVYQQLPDGSKKSNYYVAESVGLACGMLLAAIHNAGLVALTHTPSPMNFLSQILQRPDNERPFLLIPVGQPANHTLVPHFGRKPLAEIAVFYP